MSLERGNIKDCENDADLAATNNATDNTTPRQYPTCSNGCCQDIPSLNEFIYNQGFLHGDCSDVSIRAFNSVYRLHKLILSRSGFFRSLFNGPWSNSSGDVLDLQFDDEYITQESFEIAIGTLYGAQKYNPNPATTLCYSMIAIGQYLNIPHLVCRATESIIDILDITNLSENLQFAISSSYGEASERIIDSCKGVLCTNGWESGVDKWDNIPEETIVDVLSSDSFFVPTEWDRCLFFLKLIDRRVSRVSQLEGRSIRNENKSFNNDTTQIEGSAFLEGDTIVSDCSATDKVLLLKDRLRTSIHFIHLTAEQLNILDSSRDPMNEPYLESTILKNALWEQINLQRKIVSGNALPVLGLSKTKEVASLTEDGSESKYYRIPVRDETICGTPGILKSLMEDHQQSAASTVDSPEGDNNTKGESIPKAYITYTETPPFRFSIAFANVSRLNCGKRVYAKTLWCLGSYWNLYLQKIKSQRKKGFQIGVYLHRASSQSSSKNGLINPDIFSYNMREGFGTLNAMVNYDISAEESFPSPNFDEPFNELSEEIENMTIQESEFDHTYANVTYRDRERDATVSSSTENVSESENNSSFPPGKGPIGNVSDWSFLNYDDSRSKISVYFVIYTPSRRIKSAITSFTSAPDLFNKSQSWGWKSNSMCVFDENGNFPPDHDPHLKFMVCLGIT